MQLLEASRLGELKGSLQETGSRRVDPAAGPGFDLAGIACVQALEPKG